MIENDYPHISETHKALLLIALLTDQDESILDSVPGSLVTPLMGWVVKELVEERVMKVDKWLELAFHLCKQRWDATTEWLETQPMSKILLMARIMSKHNEEQNREMKKSARKK